MTVEIDDWTCRLDFPVGWVDLTSASDADADGKASWARQTVASFNPLGLVVAKEFIEEELIGLAKAAEKRQSVVAAAFYAEGGFNYAGFDVQIFGEDGVSPTLQNVEGRLRAQKSLAGEPAVTRVELPVGAALRFQGTYQSKGVFGFGKRLSESVSHAVLVPDTGDVLMATMDWTAMERSDELSEMADSLIRTLRLIPLDAVGRPIFDIGDGHD
ncbi:hypothetical protein ADL00_25440 [Streptomyces sp. AS58]|uniref:hypothetical protein n=1 Tax=Streptomyces sp. AS58 TaxID=1519489 RepID=UPI0006AE78FB|nr:hypothetical protein [Streptomyces sp. AS58]KOV59954.1 hypothetical protein ADL00_25440 [Streptomyces sp. AS58]